MKSRQIYAVSAILIVIICVIGWFFFRGYRTDITAGHENASQPKNNNEITVENSQAQRPQQNPDEEPIIIEERGAQRAKSNIMSMYSEEELATPEKQKLLAAMDSPEFDEVSKNFSTRNWYDFLESKGIPVNRDALDRVFRSHFPTGEPKDYEPEMRLEIAKMFLSAGPVDLTDPEAAASQRREVYSEFSKNKLNHVWYLAQFDEDWDGLFLWRQEGMESNSALVWMSDVQRNAASIVVNAGAASVSAPETQVSAPSWDLSDVVESFSAASDATKMSRPSIDLPSADADERVDTENRAAASEPVITDALPAPSTLPTVEELETTLKVQFSPERFERAMSTLEQYGPKEGLRRLRENDPDVAAQVERLRRREENSKGTIR